MTYQKGLEKGIDVYQLSHLLYRDQLTLWKKYQKRNDTSSKQYIRSECFNKYIHQWEIESHTYKKC